MAFAKQTAVKKVEDEIDAAMEAGIERESSSVEEPPEATADTVAVANDPPHVEEAKPDEEDDLPAPQVGNLDEQLLAGGGMELSDESIDAPSPTVGSASEAPLEAAAVAENAPEANAAGERILEGARPRLERVVGNGSPLSPNAQRKAAMEEKAAMSGYGGGGGGFGSLFAMAGSGVKSVVNGVGAGIMRAGGQRLADRFLEPSDPISVAKRLQRQRYTGFNQALKAMDAATDERAASVDRFNNLVSKSAPGRTLSDMAEAAGTNLHDFMSDVKSGKNRDALAVRCMETLERDPVLGQAAQKIASAQASFVEAERIAENNFKRLASDHAADVNVGVENNRLVDAFEKAETDIKKPLPLEASLKESDTGAENKIDTEKQHKKFMEALEKIKESIAALLSKIMSMLGRGGPK